MKFHTDTPPTRHSVGLTLDEVREAILSHVELHRQGSVPRIPDDVRVHYDSRPHTGSSVGARLTWWETES